MESAFRDPKTPSAWVELDFHARRRRLKVWKRRLTWATLFVCLGLIGTSIAASLTARRTSTWYQAAPVSSAHAIFNDDCTKCHSMAFQTAKRFWPGNANSHTVDDAKCRSCHPSATEHHGDVVKPQTACVICHREHRGREQLARVTNAHCLTCHSDLKSHYSETAYANVTGFPETHPDFAVWSGKGKVIVAKARRDDGTRQFEEIPLKNGTDDPGVIRFNHSWHLQLQERDLQMIPLEQRKSELQKMQSCDSCHQPDDTKRYMKPISHEDHCKRCHNNELRFMLLGKFQGAELKREEGLFAKTSVPHARPEMIRDVLEGRLRRLAHIDGQHIVARADVAEQERPWVRPTVEEKWIPISHQLGQPPLDKVRQFVDLQLGHGEKMLYDGGKASGCGKCHDLTPEGVRESQKPWDRTNPYNRPLPKYDRPQLPARWLLHARFNHATHRELKCTACHEAATSKETSDILLPKIAACATCHSSAAPNGGARHDCVGCHTYHEHSTGNAQIFDKIEDALRK